MWSETLGTIDRSHLSVCRVYKMKLIAIHLPACLWSPYVIYQDFTGNASWYGFKDVRRLSSSSLRASTETLRRGEVDGTVRFVVLELIILMKCLTGKSMLMIWMENFSRWGTRSWHSGVRVIEIKKMSCSGMVPVSILSSTRWLAKPSRSISWVVDIISPKRDRLRRDRI